MPIVISNQELARIQRWTDQDREDPETVRRRELVRFQDETSKKMTKTWPNSVENVNKRNEELRLARIQAAEQANSIFYSRYLRKQKEKQRQLMHSARDTIFKNKDAPKLLLSAVIETCIQKERMEQVKFNEEQRRAKAQLKRQDDDEIIRNAKEWEKLMLHKKQLRFEADKKYETEILDQANEIHERNRREYETELEMQKLDNMKANEQMEAIKEFETNFKAKEKARIWADMDKAKQEAFERKTEQNARDEMDDRLMEVLNKSKARIVKRRIQTEKNLKDQKLKVLEAISMRLESGEAARAARDEEIMNKAMKEKEEIAERRRRSQAERKERNKQDRLEQRARFLRDEAQREHETATRLQWECMNRFKNIEINDAFQEKLRDEKARKIKEYKEDILRLWKERDDREARELAETRYFYGALAEKKLRDADNKLLTHARELLDEARAHGRPDHALHKAIDRYCQLYRLYPMPALPASMQEHFQRYTPRDGSQPDDAGEKSPQPQPPPPPPAQGGKDRNGLEKSGKPSTSQKSAKVEEKPVEDYKKVGRANGLQRRNAEEDVTLPKITVIPCKNKTCSCILKQ